MSTGPLPPPPKLPDIMSGISTEIQIESMMEDSGSNGGPDPEKESADVTDNVKEDSSISLGRKRKATDAGDGESKPKTAAYFCAVCQCKLNSKLQSQGHLAGKSHKNMLFNQQKLAAGKGITGSEKVIVPAMPQQGRHSINAAGFGYSSERFYWQFNNDHTSNPMTNPIPVQFKKPIVDAKGTGLGISCVICNIVFNSKSQADAHSTGRKHMAAAMKSGKVSLPSVDTMEVVSVPTKNAADVPIAAYEKKIKDTPLKCDICGLAFNSQSQAVMHFDGRKHAAAVANKAEGITTTINTESGGKALTGFSCAVCNLSLNSQGQLDQHLTSDRHKRNEGNATAINAESGSKASTAFSCAVCVVPLNSQDQLDQHLNSDKHKRKVGSSGLKCDSCNLQLNSQNQLEIHLRSSRHKMILEGRVPQGRGRGRGFGRGGRGRGGRGRWFRGKSIFQKDGTGGRGLDDNGSNTFAWKYEESNTFQRGGSRGRSTFQRGGGRGRGENKSMLNPNGVFRGRNQRGGRGRGGRGRGSNSSFAASQEHSQGQYGDSQGQYGDSQGQYGGAEGRYGSSEEQYGGSKGEYDGSQGEYAGSQEEHGDVQKYVKFLKQYGGYFVPSQQQHGDSSYYDM